MGEQHISDWQDQEAQSPVEQQEGARIEQFYDDDPYAEWQRLERHRMEFAVTMRTLTDYLPPAPQAILDAGGGPGRYALALSSLGYQVTLLDLSQNNLRIARQKAQEYGSPLHQYMHGNALYLSSLLPMAFDAVLLLGPLYHLQDERERQQAICEAWRVLRPGGLVFVAFITRYAAFRDLAKNAPSVFIEKRAEWEATLSTGVYHADQWGGFTDAFFAHPSEITPLLEGVGFETLDLLGCEGVVAANEEQINQLTDEAWETWVDLNYRLGKEPSLHGASDHLLYVGRKPEG